MAFTLEDGTGVADANAYISVAYADAYHLERGNTGWTGTNDAKQIAIIRATDYVETRWIAAFRRGRPEFLETPQGLGFPRLYLWDTNGTPITGVPELLKRAVAEYALRALTEVLMPDPTPVPATGFVSGLREKVGPIETETSYQQVNSGAPAGSASSALRAYPVADRLIRLLLGITGPRVFR